jgi:hypothetical protein
MSSNPLSDLISFVDGLQQAGVAHSIGCVRDAIMVTIPMPDRHVEAEFFADGHVEVQFFGPPASEIREFTPAQLLDAVVEHLASDSDLSPLDAPG